MASKGKSESERAVSGGAAAARAPRKTSRTKHSSASIDSPELGSPEVAASTESDFTAAVIEEVPPQADAHFEKIAQLAYSYWEARGCREGSPEEDWFRAERELRSLHSVKAGA